MKRSASPYRSLASLTYWTKFQEILAAIAGIPMTTVEQPVAGGHERHGKSDANNYAMHVAAMQKRILQTQC